jgi:hypothetical protein
MRTLAAPSDGDVACTRMPPISFSIMTMSPGVMRSFSSISSRSRTSTRIGWSSRRWPVRVADTVTKSASAGARLTTTSRVPLASMVTVATAVTKPSAETLTAIAPGAT